MERLIASGANSESAYSSASALKKYVLLLVELNYPFAYISLLVYDRKPESNIHRHYADNA
jgi:hypothetical protein